MGTKILTPMTFLCFTSCEGHGAACLTEVTMRFTTRRVCPLYPRWRFLPRMMLGMRTTGGYGVFGSLTLCCHGECVQTFMLSLHVSILARFLLLYSFWQVFCPPVFFPIIWWGKRPSPCVAKRLICLLFILGCAPKTGIILTHKTCEWTTSSVEASQVMTTCTLAKLSWP